jgi:hypothetical protein
MRTGSSGGVPMRTGSSGPGGVRMTRTMSISIADFVKISYEQNAKDKERFIKEQAGRNVLASPTPSSPVSSLRSPSVASAEGSPILEPVAKPKREQDSTSLSPPAAVLKRSNNLSWSDDVSCHILPCFQATHKRLLADLCAY